MSYQVLALLSVVVFALIHLSANMGLQLEKLSKGKFLSASGGIAISYVFVDILPKLCETNVLLKTSGIFPYIEKHVFLMALTGFLLFFIVERISAKDHPNRSYRLSFGSYALFNFFIGYAVVDIDNPEVRPLSLFTVAMGLHFFINDYNLTRAHEGEYDQTGRWLLVGCLFLGWFTGLWTTIPAPGIALVSAFIGGGVIMSVTSHELPSHHVGERSLTAFLVAAVFYTIILLTLG